MKKYIYLAFGLLLLANLGCISAYATYPTVYDNEGFGNFIVNTNGKAHLWENGGYYSVDGMGYIHEGVSFLDQTATGFHRISNYEYIGLIFHDYPWQNQLQPVQDKYCTPDWNGCAFSTTEYQTPFNASAICNEIDLKLTSTPNCSYYGDYWTIFCYPDDQRYRLGECGRAAHNRVSVPELTALLGMGSLRSDGLLEYNINASNTRVTFNGQNFALKGSINALWDVQRGRTRFDMSHPLMENNKKAMGQILRNGNAGTLTIQFGDLVQSHNVIFGGGSL